MSLDELTDWVQDRWGHLRPGEIPDTTTLAAQSLAASPLASMQWPRESPDHW
ncbi:hypothetical protein ACSCBZ_46310 [Streptomyces niveiscabiei]|uniref:hypothetical protein n=1 Tax=Streptomyces niveiscabiei TaxID=164115 RepID=UPI000A885028|nr:hypothetical protein [Streptomyces niveiscabiei]